jgi:hypothetical protein
LVCFYDYIAYVTRNVGVFVHFSCALHTCPLAKRMLFGTEGKSIFWYNFNFWVRS